MSTRHAIASSSAQPYGGVLKVMTRCGIWADVEVCDEDIRATCETCKARIKAATTPRRWSKVEP